MLADVETRIVQRAILDVLQDIQDLQPFFRNPYSFGGIKRKSDDMFAAVPAAIKAVLDGIQDGARYVACADITAFFTKIPKGRVADIVAEAVNDNEFMAFFRDAIQVDLANLADLKRYAERFPIGDIGVAQGSSLSPLLGNVILAEFDEKMNEGDCRCIRYIDDFVILGPTDRAVMARLRLAKRILGDLGMELARDKTSTTAVPIGSGFEFLGIELNNGWIRPSSKARANFLAAINSTFEQGQKALVGYRNGQPLPKSEALLGVLKRVDGVIQGWGKHYRFCNDELCFKNLDNKVGEAIRAYLGIYSQERRNLAPDYARTMLGIELLGTIDRTPFAWPSKTAAITPTQSLPAAST